MMAIDEMHQPNHCFSSNLGNGSFAANYSNLNNSNTLNNLRQHHHHHSGRTVAGNIGGAIHPFHHQHHHLPQHDGSGSSSSGGGSGSGGASGTATTFSDVYHSWVDDFCKSHLCYVSMYEQFVKSAWKVFCLFCFYCFLHLTFSAFDLRIYVCFVQGTL